MSIFNRRDGCTPRLVIQKSEFAKADSIAKLGDRFQKHEFKSMPDLVPLAIMADFKEHWKEPIVLIEEPLGVFSVKKLFSDFSIQNLAAFLAFTDSLGEVKFDQGQHF